MERESSLLCTAVYRFSNGELEHVILTQEAGSTLSSLHHRKPIMFSRESLKDWFSDRGALANPLNEEELKLYPVSSKVNKTSFNSPVCLKEEHPLERDLFLDL